MFNWLNRKLTLLYDKKVPSTGLGIFRILFAILLLAEIVNIFYFRHLIYDPIPYLEVSEIDFGPILVIWMVVIFFLMIGLFTRYVAIINYILCFLAFNCYDVYEYHLDYTITAVCLCLVFVPVGKSFSIDNLIKKIKYSNFSEDYPINFHTSILSYYSIIVLGMGLIYFDSVFHKIVSYYWLNGLGVWAPASMPPITWTSLQFLLDQKLLMMIMGYITLVFEFLFIFLFWHRRFRIPLLIVGVLLHLGILVIFPIPLFAYGFIILYVLMIPFRCWRLLAKKFQYKNAKVSVYYNKEDLFHLIFRIFVQHFDILKATSFKDLSLSSSEISGSMDLELKGIICSKSKDGSMKSGSAAYIQILKSVLILSPLALILLVPGLIPLFKNLSRNFNFRKENERLGNTRNNEIVGVSGYQEIQNKSLVNLLFRSLNIKLICFGIVVLAFFVLCSIMNSSSVGRVIVLSNSNVLSELRQASKQVVKVSRILTGIKPHGVFVDPQIMGYNHVVAVTYKKDGREVWLPLTNKDGQVGAYNIGRIWAYWAFRSTAPAIDQKKLESGILRLSAFYAKKNSINLDSATFVVKVKKIEVPMQWEKGFLERQMEKPWQDIGSCTWRNNECTVIIPEVERL